MRELLRDAAERASRYLEELGERSVQPATESIEALRELRVPLPESPTSPEEVLRLLDEMGSPATIASAGRRYFGFVTGGSLPASLAANVLAGAWDQNAAFAVGSPVAAVVEEITLGWIRDLLSLPAAWGGGFVTGTTMGNFSCLATARDTVLERAGWDARRQGLFGAPEVRVIVGEEVHSTLVKALGLAGLGRDRVQRVGADEKGRMRTDALPPLEGPTILCLQAGNVNTGSFDPIAELAPRARAAGAWVHVDGAFGLWAKASPRTASLAAGIEEVDSIATDLHKWLNVPYDSGLALYRDPERARRTLSMTAAYLPQNETQREPCDYTPEASRRARGIEAWAALLSLGRSGFIDLVDRCCAYAQDMASRLSSAGFDVLNDVELNQVLVAFGSDERSRAVVDAVQREGTCWCGPSFWQGRAAMRISFSSWATTPSDVERSFEAIARVANDVASKP